MKQVICTKQNKGQPQPTKEICCSTKNWGKSFFLSPSLALSLQSTTQHRALMGASCRFPLSLPTKKSLSLRVNIPKLSGRHLLLQQTPRYSKHRFPPKQKPINCMSYNLLKRNNQTKTPKFNCFLIWNLYTFCRWLGYFTVYYKTFSVIINWKLIVFWCSGWSVVTAVTHQHEF